MASKTSATRTAPRERAPARKAAPKAVSPGLLLPHRLAFATFVVVAGLLGLLGFVLDSKVGDTLTVGIDRAGVAMARALASPGIYAWTEAGGTPLAMNYYGPDDLPQLDKEIGALDATQQKTARDVREFNKQRLQALISDPEFPVVGAWIEGHGGTILVKGSPRTRFESAGESKVGTTLVAGGTLTGDGAPIPARRFRHPIVDHERDKVRGFAVVVLASTVGAADRAGLRTTLGVVAALVAALSGVGAFLLARLPSRRLVHMAQAIRRILPEHPEYHTPPTAGGEARLLGDALEFFTTEVRAVGSERPVVGGDVTVLRELRENLAAAESPGLPGFELDGIRHTGREGGADFYDQSLMADGRVAAWVASASGCGVAAPMVVAMARAHLRNALATASDPASALGSVNQALAQELKRGMFVTCQMLVVDAERHEAQLLSAGSRLRAIKCAAGKAEWLSAEGLALGLDKGPVFERTLRPVPVAMPPGTRLVLVNEGAARVSDQAGKALGEDALLELLRTQSPKNTAAFLPLVLSRIEEHAGGDGLATDLVLVTTKRTT